MPISRPGFPGSRVRPGRAGACASLVPIGIRVLLVAIVSGGAASVAADVWVFEPSISLDQRFDDNYRLETELERQVSATRLVGDLGLSRESRTTAFRGGVRVDALLTAGEYEGDELDSNRVLFLDTTTGNERTKYGVDLNFKQDTPSRDISADLSSAAAEATDSGVVTQRSNVARRQFIVAPRITHALSRRVDLEAQLTFTAVDHDLPSPQDAIYTRYIGLYNAQNQPGASNPNLVPEAEDGAPLPIDEVSSETEGVGIFTPDGELDDYRELKLALTWRYALTTISSVSAIAAVSRYEADLEAETNDFNQLEREGELDIFRRPRGRLGLSTTQSFRLGYERELTETLKGGVQAGIYTNTSDDTDTYRPSDLQENETFDPERLASLESEQDGWLANVTLTKDAGITRYSARFGVDVQPSSIGTQVETQELIVDVNRTLSPLLDVSFRARAYEPDRLGANPDDRFARRFLSLEPKIVYRFRRAWTAAASYRYRRQKSRVETASGASNALLFSLTYTPPSAIRDAANETGL